MSYFLENFPYLAYDFQLNGVKTVVHDIFRYTDVIESPLNDPYAYLLIDILDGERPDNVSQRIYGTPDYHWTFFIANDFLKSGLSEWPKGQYELSQYIEELYGDYGVIEFAFNPESLSTNLSPIGSDINKKILEGNDLYLAYDIDSDTVAYIKIVKWDSNRFQLWVDKRYQYTLTDESDLKNVLGDSDSEYPVIDTTNQSEFLSAWESDIREFRVIGTDVSYSVRVATRAWEEAGNAPDRYYIGNTSNIITALDALNTYANDSELYYDTYSEVLEESNAARARIQAIRPGLIRQFSETYSELMLK